MHFYCKNSLRYLLKLGLGGLIDPLGAEDVKCMAEGLKI